MRKQVLVCDSCSNMKEIDWDKWSEEVLTFDICGTNVRICKDCQNKSESFRKNAARYALERIKEYGDDRK